MSNQAINASHVKSHTNPGLRFCPKCANRLAEQMIEGKIRQTCTACDFVFYRDPKPVAGVLAFKDNQLLLIQRGNEPKYGLWSFPTGFIDIGDTPEQTAIREAREEANVEVELERLSGVYSNERRTIVLVVYVGTIVSGVPTGGAEALDARLFGLKSLPEFAFDHDYRIVADVLNHPITDKENTYANHS